MFATTSGERRAEQPGGFVERAVRRSDDPALRAARRAGAGLAWARLAAQPGAIALFEELYGDYPFEAIGAIVDWAPNVFYALESQTKPNYWQVPSISTFVHEIASGSKLGQVNDRRTSG